ncbi:hypothetical protein [Actinomyces gaoshouyii]|uniref:hypothetical protein n=1 Tax=Actinomyces gaoshouyii TaxID=1960083 RepID=UPI0009BE5A85|nr:hypothetical protein [Actinomyces gaoshouyii]ARD41288.1 hypothetical protein B6G06_01925 [Actinomyces gaoshouyii]
MVLTSVVVLAALAVCAVAVHGPVSRIARHYVGELLTEAVTGSGQPVDPIVPGAVRRQHLLLSAPQTVLFLVVGGLACAVALVAGQWFEAALALPVVAALTVAGSTDAVCHRLPNVLLGLAAVGAGVGIAAAVGLALAAGGQGARVLAPVVGSLGAAAALGGVGLLLSLVPSGFGMGDVKLLALVGLWLGRFGWAVPVVGTVLGLFLAGTVAIVLMAVRRARRDTMIAMGPYLIGGALTVWALAVV